MLVTVTVQCDHLDLTAAYVDANPHHPFLRAGSTAINT
jgi:hypothetical protein